MRISLRWATIVASLFLVCFVANQAFTQNGPRPAVQQGSSGSGIVVIDISKVFREHVRFKQAMDAMKKDVDTFEGSLRMEQEQLTKVAEKRKEFNPGTPEYKNFDQQIAQNTANLQVRMQIKKKEFMQREAKLYYDVYTEVINEITKFSDKYNINMVLRYNSDPINSEDRQSVLAGVNQPIVFQRNLDITKFITDEINRGAAGNNVRRPPIPGQGNGINRK